MFRYRVRMEWVKQFQLTGAIAHIEKESNHPNLLAENKNMVLVNGKCLTGAIAEGI